MNEYYVQQKATDSADLGGINGKTAPNVVNRIGASVQTIFLTFATDASGDTRIDKASPERFVGSVEFSRIEITHKPAAAHGWTCFHCGETFTTPGAARDHFGFDPSSDPACQIKVGAERGLVMALRKAEADLEEMRSLLHDESSEAYRLYAAQTTRHRSQIIAAEEAGYEKGLADGRTMASKYVRSDSELRIGDAVRIVPEIAGMDWQGEPPHYITGIDWHPKHGVTYTTSEVWPPRYQGHFVEGLTDEWQSEHLSRTIDRPPSINGGE